MTAPRTRTKRPNGRDPMDAHVGARIRQRRTLLGLSQEALGRRLDLTFQQIQKYERGANRIGAGRLWRIAGILDVEPGWFYEGFDEAAARDRPAIAGGNGAPADSFNRRETLELVRAYYALPRPARRKLVDLVRVFAAGR